MYSYDNIVIHIIRISVKIFKVIKNNNDNNNDTYTSINPPVLNNDTRNTLQLRKLLPLSTTYKQHTNTCSQVITAEKYNSFCYKVRSASLKVC